MKPFAHGVDIVSCDRLRKAIEKHGDRFLHRVFTQVELDYCAGKKRRIEHLAGRFAAKEAVLKVLGTGWQNGISWTEIEVSNLPSGQPQVNLSGKCKQIAEGQGLQRFLISISHIETHAISSAIALDGEVASH